MSIFSRLASGTESASECEKLNSQQLIDSDLDHEVKAAAKRDTQE